MTYTRRLRLESLHNARDLGGYAVPGGTTKYGVFVRSEMPVDISESDEKALRDYGITISIDFRSSPEAAARPSELIGKDWVEYKHIPTFPEDKIDPANPESWRTNVHAEGFKWGYAYITMIDQGQRWAKECIEIAANCEGVLHYHCFTGKDRTGVFTALLLGLVGVCDEDIAADYSMSQSLLDPFYAKNIKDFSKTDRDRNLSNPFVFTSPTNMFMLLDYIKEKFGSVEGFIKECGVSDETINKLKDKFIEKI